MNLKLLTTAAASALALVTITPVFGQGGSTGASTAGQSAVERQGQPGAQPTTPDASRSATGGSSTTTSPGMATGDRTTGTSATDRRNTGMSASDRSTSGVATDSTQGDRMARSPRADRN